MDILLPYVDMQDPAWQETFLQAKHLPCRTPKAREALLRPFQRRFASYGLFKYWFRALEQNFQGDCTVHLLLMQESQTPLFLRPGDPRVQVHYHEDFIPSALRPCFDSNTIELCAMKAISLSLVFLLANDDMYFNQPCGPEDFCNGARPLTRVLEKPGYAGSQFQLTLENGRRLLEHVWKKPCPAYAWHHLFQAYQEDFVQQFLNAHWPLILPRLHQWRSPQDVTHFMLMAGQILSGVAEDSHSFPTDGYFDCARLADVPRESLLKPKAICLNDSGGVGMGLAKAYLESRYPAPSSFEA